MGKLIAMIEFMGLELSPSDFLEQGVLHDIC